MGSVTGMTSIESILAPEKEEIVVVFEQNGLVTHFLAQGGHRLPGFGADSTTRTAKELKNRKPVSRGT